MIECFWLFNVSKRIIFLPELGFHIHPGRKHNLLDKRYFKYSLETLIDCYKFGTISKKRRELLVKITENRVSVNDKLPNHDIIEVSDVPMKSKFNMKLEIAEEKFEELEFTRPTDEQFAEEFSEIYDDKSEIKE